MADDPGQAQIEALQNLAIFYDWVKQNFPPAHLGPFFDYQDVHEMEVDKHRFIGEKNRQLLGELVATGFDVPRDWKAARVSGAVPRVVEAFTRQPPSHAIEGESIEAAELRELRASRGTVEGTVIREGCDVDALDSICREISGHIVELHNKPAAGDEGDDKTERPREPDGPWSKPDRPSEWAKVFGTDARTFSRWIKAGKIPAKVIDEKNVMVRLDFIPRGLKR